MLKTSNGSPKKKPQMSKCVRETDANLGLGAVSLVNKRLTSLEGLGVQNGLVKLYLQNNCLESFEFLSSQPHLKELYVQNNMIKSYKGLELQPKLDIFGIAGNPICEKPLYRVMALLAVGPSLRRIDDEMLSQVERMTASRLSPKAVQAIRLGAIIDYKKRTDEDFDEIINRLTSKSPSKQNKSSTPTSLPSSPLALSLPPPADPQKVEIVYRSHPPGRGSAQDDSEQEELILRALKEIENADLDYDEESPEPDAPPTPEEHPELPPSYYLSHSSLPPSDPPLPLPHPTSKPHPPDIPLQHSYSLPQPPPLPPSYSSPRSQPPSLPTSQSFPRTSQPPPLPLKQPSPSSSQVFTNPSPRSSLPLSQPPPPLPTPPTQAPPLPNPSPRNSLPSSQPPPTLPNPSPRSSLPISQPPLPPLPSSQNPHQHQHIQIPQNHPLLNENGKGEEKPEKVKLTTRTDWEMQKLKEKIKQLKKDLVEERNYRQELQVALQEEKTARIDSEAQLHAEKENANNLAFHLNEMTERCNALTESNETLQEEKLELAALSAERLLAEREQRKLIEEKFEKASPTKGASGRKTGETEFVSIKDMCQIDTIQFYTVIRKDSQNVAACISFHDDGISLMNTETSQATEFPLKSSVKMVKESDTLMTLFGGNNNVVLNDKRIDLIANLINYWLTYKK